MTTNMIITLAIVIAMVVVIISDKLPFGAPALLAAALLVVTNQIDVATAFSGFTDKNVIMIMGFMATMAALQKTTFIHRLEGVLTKFAKKGGIVGFILLILVIMAVGNFISGTAFYILVITLVSTIPYNKELPTSRILIPSAFATYSSGWLPNSVVLFAGLVASLCESAGYTGDTTINVGKFCLMNLAWSVVYLIWAVIAHKFLPDRDISDNKENDELAGGKKEFVKTLSDTQETVVYVLYVVMLLSLVFQSKIPGEISYGLPILIAGVYMCVGALSFKEMLGSMFSPVMIMMASVIGVAQGMAASGLSAFIGGKIAGILGASPSLFVLVLIFALLTSILATFTGASFGSLFITGPIGIALCMQYGLNPVPLALACVKSAWINYFMPIDGMPALTMGVGKYKLTEFWRFVLPMWILNMLTVVSLSVILFQ